MRLNETFETGKKQDLIHLEMLALIIKIFDKSYKLDIFIFNLSHFGEKIFRRMFYSIIDKSLSSTYNWHLNMIDAVFHVLNCW